MMRFSTSSKFVLGALLLSHTPNLSALPVVVPLAINTPRSPPSHLQMPLATQALARRQCDNKLQNADFEYGLDPWFPMVSGSWETRGVFTTVEGGHKGSSFYYGHSNSTIPTTLTLAQSSIDLPNGASAICTVWVASSRPENVGSTRIEVFLDAQSCGVQYLGNAGWTQVGGQVAVSGDGATHALAVVIESEQAAQEGWSVWIDDLFVGVGC